MKRMLPGADAGHPVSGRTHQDVAPEPAEVCHDDRLPTPWHRVPEHQPWRRAFGLGPRSIGDVPHQLIERAACDLGREVAGVVQPELDPLSDGIAGRAGDGVMKLTLKQQAPCMAQEGPVIAAPGELRQGRERLRHSGEGQLGQTMPPLEWGAGRVDSLKSPGVAIGPAQLTTDDR